MHLDIVFFCTATATTEIYTYGHTRSLPDALPIFAPGVMRGDRRQHLRHLEVRMAGEEVDHAEELEPLPLYRAHPAALLARRLRGEPGVGTLDRKSTRLNSSH